MKKLKITAGVIISIPLENSYVVAKILHISEYFKDIALLKVYKCRATMSDPYSELFCKESFELIHTGISFIKNGRWKVIDQQSLSTSEKKLKKRIVGGDVWDGDACLRRASDVDLTVFPTMRVTNIKAVEERVARYDFL